MVRTRSQHVGFRHLPPEIKMEIIGYLGDDRTSLVSAIRVNKEWAEYCTNVLWKDIPADLLCRTEPRSRRLFYARKVRALTHIDIGFGDQPPSRKALEGIEFPQLSGARLIHTDWALIHRWFRPWFQPALESLSIHDCDGLSRDSFDMIVSNCPNLQHLRYSGSPHGVLVDWFLQLLRNLKSLESVFLIAEGRRHAQPSISNAEFVRIFSYLAGRESLISLELRMDRSGSVLTSEHFSEATQQNSGKPLFQGFANAEGDGPDTSGEGASQAYLTEVATRSFIYIQADNPKIGLICVMPVGMVEVSTCDITVKEGQHVKKGDELGMVSSSFVLSCL